MDISDLPRLRPRRHGSDSDLDTTANTTLNESAVSELPDVFSPPKLMRCTSTPAAIASMASVAGLSFGQPASGSKKQWLSQIPKFPAVDLTGSSNVTTDSDSGFGTDLSSISPPSQSTGAIPKLRLGVTTRSRTASSSDDSHLFLTPDSVPRKVKNSKRKTLKDRDISHWTSRSESTSRSIPSSVIRYKPGTFESRETLDVVRRLADMSMDHVLELIWSGLDTCDLAAASQVSTHWNAAVQHSKSAYFRWKEAKDKWSENSKPRGRSRKATLLKKSPRKALGNVSNVIADDSLVVEPKSPSKRTPIPPAILVSPSKFRHRVFADEASRLGPQEQLRSCPRCTMPSRLNLAENRAQCTRISCKFDFCTKCMCEYHDNQPCRTSVKVSPCRKGRKSLTESFNETGNTRTRRRLSTTVASEKSKSRLKRLF